MAKEASREALLRAGIELFAEQGLDGPSLDAICARAGYTRGAFYVHFSDRDQFLEEVLSRVLEGYVATIVSEGRPEDLRRTFHGFLLATTPGPGPVDLLSPAGAAVHLRVLLEGCRRSPSVRARFTAGFLLAAEALEHVVAVAQDAGRVRGDLDRGAVSRLLVTLVLGLLASRETGIPGDELAGLQELLRLLEPRSA